MTVYLVGAGPGDPGLLTVRGAEVLATAEVVVFDRLSVGPVLDLAPASAERINVGKRPGHNVMEQEDINRLLIDRGSRGQPVVRLKGGDPFVFARGGEEALALDAAGVDYEVVPGISSALAVPAYAGIPVTQRHSSELFTVITGHEDPDKGGELDWEAVARLGGTIVILMGVGRIAKIVDRLLAGGLAPDTPAATVRWGTRPNQQVVRTTLAGLPGADLASPSVIVVGRVAGIELDWFTSRPLLGRRVVVTRTRSQASALSSRLRQAGADPVELPLIEIADPSDGGEGLRRAIAELPSTDWVVLTSPNGAERFLAGLGDARQLGGVALAAIGPATADVLRAGNLVADLVPEEFVAESLVDAFPVAPATGGRVTLARAREARDVVPDGLAAKGWTVEVVEAYQTVPAAVDDAGRAVLAGADAITFTSSSTVDHFVTAFGAAAAPPLVACIGPVTAATARRHGLVVDVEADVHTIAGLVDALVAAVAPPTPGPAGSLAPAAP